jgi:hypothetical protein
MCGDGKTASSLGLEVERLIVIEMDMLRSNE